MTTTFVLKSPSSSKLVGAIEANLYAHVSLYSHLPGAIVYDEPDIVGLMTDLDPYESCVYRAVFTSEQADERIERVLQRFRSHKCLPMQWIVGPSSQPEDLGKRLLEKGLSYFAHPPGMAASLKDLEMPSTWSKDFIVQRVENSAQLLQWIEIATKVEELSESLKKGYYVAFKSQGFDTEAPSQLFIGMEKGLPISTGRLLCAAGVAGIHSVTTLPEARGRGYGTAMTLAAAQFGRRLGYQIGVLFATPAGVGLYRRLGFQAYMVLDVYKSPVE
jgi:ribosomal protein S18 acetylase RimI-like enzyme